MAELEGLGAVARRNLADAAVRADVISADTRFACAYEAALALATMAIAAAGYRVKGPSHLTTFQAVRLAMPGDENTADSTYFDACRRLRNKLSYEAAEIVAERDVEELLRRVTAFRDRVESVRRSRP